MGTPAFVGSRLAHGQRRRHSWMITIGSETFVSQAPDVWRLRLNQRLRESSQRLHGCGRRHGRAMVPQVGADYAFSSWTVGTLPVVGRSCAGSGCAAGSGRRGSRVMSRAPRWAVT